MFLLRQARLVPLPHMSRQNTFQLKLPANTTCHSTVLLVATMETLSLQQISAIFLVKGPPVMGPHSR